jgi:integrase
VYIPRTFSKGRLGPTKTKGSAKRVALPEALYPELRALCEIAVATGCPCPWLFPSTRRRKNGVLNPVSSANWLKRVLKPAAAKLGFDIDLRMFRRGFATIANETGTKLTDIQSQLWHASVTTTANIYIQPVPASVRAAVEKVDQVLRRRRRRSQPSRDP